MSWRKLLEILGILPRDLSRNIEDKKLEISATVMKICRTEGADFIDVNVITQRSGYLATDGLHLNWM